MLLTLWGSNPQPPDHQSDAHPTEVTVTLTFAIRVIYWLTNIPSKFKASSFKHCQMISFSVLKVMVTLFVCVEVLRPSQPNGVMSSAVSLPNHMFTGQA